MGGKKMKINLLKITTGVVEIVPVFVAIVQAIKMTGRVPDKYAPIASILVGIIIAFVSHGTATTMGQTILSGVMYGLMASGLYSGIKTTMPTPSPTAQAKKKQND